MERRARNRFWRLLKARIYSIMWKTDMYAIRFLLAMSAITCGLYNKQVLAPIFLIQGLVMLWSLVCNKRPNSTLWIDAVLGCALWTYTALTPAPTSLGVEIWIASASWWLLVRYYSDEEKTNVVI